MKNKVGVLTSANAEASCEHYGTVGRICKSVKRKRGNGNPQDGKGAEARQWKEGGCVSTNGAETAR